MQIMEGDLIRTIRDNHEYIAHFHTGGVPGRHELDGTQEVTWRAVATAIADLKFDGYVAHEFVPTRDPLTSLREAVVALRRVSRTPAHRPGSRERRHTSALIETDRMRHSFPYTDHLRRARLLCGALRTSRRRDRPALGAHGAAAPPRRPRRRRAAAARRAKPEDTEVWEPVPKVVTPGATTSAPPVRRDRALRRQEPRSVGDDEGQVAGRRGRSPTAS